MSSVSEHAQQRAQGNHPPPGDTTSAFRLQNETRKFAPVSERGLVDQTTDGQPLGNELEDAYQGADALARRKYVQEGEQGQGQTTTENFRFGSVNPYGRQSLETREQAEQRLKEVATEADPEPEFDAETLPIGGS